MTRRLFAAVAASLVFAAGAGADEKKIRVLIIDGVNNHNWKQTTPFLKGQLEKTGKFTVDVTTSPPAGAPDTVWTKWRPKFTDYDVLLSNYNNKSGRAAKPDWPDEVKKAFVEYIMNGGGLVNVHGANNAHPGWQEFEKMTGLLWRGAGYGWRVALDDSKSKVRKKPGEGRGAGHGPQHGYTVTVVEPDHPITKGMPQRWRHAKDELYHGQRGPAEGMNILAVAYSDKSKRGTGYYEPMVWWIGYGKGKAVTCVMGHVSRGDKTNFEAMRCVGFLTTVKRCCEWAATGKVTTPVPENFPTADKTSSVSR